MATKLMSTAAALLATALLTACGSSTTSSSQSRSTGSDTTSRTSTATATSTTVAATVHGRTVVLHVGGVKGAQADVAVVKSFTHVHRGGAHAHINGLQGLSLTQKLATLLNGVAALWQAEFQHAGSQLPQANAVLVAGTPFTCGSTQITSSSPPEYCPANQTIALPQGFIESNVAPLGDSALLLLVSDLYGYHVENALGAFTHGYTGAQLEEMDSCFSGVYFYYAEGQGLLQPTDEEGVNKLLAVSAPAAGTTAGANAVTAAELATAFNKGILSNLNPAVCVPAT